MTTDSIPNAPRPEPPWGGIRHEAVARSLVFWFEVARTPYCLRLFRPRCSTSEAFIQGLRWQDASVTSRLKLHLLIGLPIVTPSQTPGELATIEFLEVFMDHLLDRADVLAQIKEQYKFEGLNCLYPNEG
jgi:hypothetical protein